MTSQRADEKDEGGSKRGSGKCYESGEDYTNDKVDVDCPHVHIVEWSQKDKDGQIEAAIDINDEFTGTLRQGWLGRWRTAFG